MQLPNCMLMNEDVYVFILTWLCTVLSWLLKVMVRLVEVLGATWVIKGVLLWFTVSYMLTRRLQISMFWKHDFTLNGQRGRETRGGMSAGVLWQMLLSLVQYEDNINNNSRGLLSSYCVLCGKSRRCDMVTKGWLSVSIGVILLSASMVSILVNKSMNSLLSAFSASMSLPSRSDVMFTWRQETNTLSILEHFILWGWLIVQGLRKKISPAAYSHRGSY